MNAYKYYIRTVNIICCLFAFKMSYTQKLYPQSVMSSMGIMDNTISISLPINLKSNTACIDVQSGIAVFDGNNGFGTFEINCAIKQQFNTIGIKLFPNPVINNTKIKFINPPPFSEDFNITIWNAEGEIIRSQKENGYTISNGLLIDLSLINPGGYILKVESTKYAEAIKFVKAN